MVLLAFGPGGGVLWKFWGTRAVLSALLTGFARSVDRRPVHFLVRVLWFRVWGSFGQRHHSLFNLDRLRKWSRWQPDTCPERALVEVL